MLSEMLFDNKYTRMGKRYYAECGSRIAPVYTLAATEKGVIELEITGQKDLYSEIQSHADSVDIKSILLRYEHGETEVLKQRNGTYVDITELPTSFAGILQLVISAENEFAALPLEIRKEYNYNASEYIADIGSERWMSIFGRKETATDDKEQSAEKIME